jgi:DNA polymerase III alpha subunit (gram-positive type)
MPYFLAKKLPEFRQRPLLFLDFELTGLDVNKHEIIEVAALVVNQPKFEIINSYYTKILPAHIETADPKSIEISGYSRKLWADAIPLKTALIELSVLAPDCILAGWIVQTEWTFLTTALEKENLPYFFNQHVIEVYSLAFAYLYKIPGIIYLNLASAAKHFGIPLEHHRPDSDIKATYEIFKKIMNSMS